MANPNLTANFKKCIKTILQKHILIDKTLYGQDLFIIRRIMSPKDTISVCSLFKPHHETVSIKKTTFRISSRICRYLLLIIPIIFLLFRSSCGNMNG
jgi:hypothetical protein